VEKLTPSKSPPRTRLLTDDEIRSIWGACDHLEDRPLPDDAGFSPLGHRIPRSPGSFPAIVKLLILTGQRRNEIASLRAEHIKDGVCTLPSALTKNKREHAIPLGALAADILSSYAPKTGLLFPARGSRETPFNGWSKSKAALDQRLTLEPWTLHDLRRYFSSTMARLGVRLEVTERLLNHVSGTQSGVAGIYNRHTYSRKCARLLTPTSVIYNN
jgi:integrase